MVKYIWQNPSWPKFTWQTNELIKHLSEAKKEPQRIFSLRYNIIVRSKLDAKVENPNLQTVDVSSLSTDHDTLKLHFTRRDSVTICL